MERESREKETRILNLTRDLEDLRDRLEESERQKQQQARELEDIVSHKDDVGKNVCTLKFHFTFIEDQLTHPAFTPQGSHSVAGGDPPTCQGISNPK